MLSACSRYFSVALNILPQHHLTTLTHSRTHTHTHPLIRCRSSQALRAAFEPRITSLETAATAAAARIAAVDEAVQLAAAAVDALVHYAKPITHISWLSCFLYPALSLLVLIAGAQNLQHERSTIFKPHHLSPPLKCLSDSSYFPNLSRCLSRLNLIFFVSSLYQKSGHSAYLSALNASLAHTRTELAAVATAQRQIAAQLTAMNAASAASATSASATSGSGSGSSVQAAVAVELAAERESLRAWVKEQV
jgi:hypothetical protein